MSRSKTSQKIITTGSTGFTIMEFTVVMVIASIVSTVAVITWPGNNISLNASVRELASNTRYTQNLSMTKGASYKLVKTTTSQYKISQIGNPSPNNDILIRTVNFDHGIRFSNLTNSQLSFNGKGTPYVNGTLLSQILEIQLNLDGETGSVFISPETGRVYS